MLRAAIAITLIAVAGSLHAQEAVPLGQKKPEPATPAPQIRLSTDLTAPAELPAEAPPAASVVVGRLNTVGSLVIPILLADPSSEHWQGAAEGIAQAARESRVVRAPVLSMSLTDLLAAPETAKLYGRTVGLCLGCVDVSALAQTRSAGLHDVDFIGVGASMTDGDPRHVDLFDSRALGTRAAEEALEQAGGDGIVWLLTDTSSGDAARAASFRAKATDLGLTKRLRHLNADATLTSADLYDALALSGRQAPAVVVILDESVAAWAFPSLSGIRIPPKVVLVGDGPGFERLTSDGRVAAHVRADYEGLLQLAVARAREAPEAFAIGSLPPRVVRFADP